MKKIDKIANESITNQLSDTIKIIEQKGAVIIKGLISKETALQLKKDLEIGIKDDELKRGRDYVFYGMIHALMTRNQSFLDLLTNPSILQITRGVLGKGAIIHAYNSSSMPPSGSNFSRSIHVDCPRLIPNYITNLGLTIALDTFTLDNGAMEIMPLSFQEANAPTEERFEKESISLVDLEVGDAIFFNARCWHRGGINKTNQWRHAVTLNCCRAFMRQQFDFTAMFSENQSNLFPDDLKQFLGYSVRIPKSMEDFLLPADKRLYKSGQE